MPDHSYFEELAALSAGGHLAAEELLEFQEHASTCAECQRAEADFIEVVRSGLPLTQSPVREFYDRLKYRPEDGMRERFLRQARANGIAVAPEPNRGDAPRPVKHFGSFAAVAGASALVTALVVLALYPKLSSPPPPLVSAQSQAKIEDLQRENSDLKGKLAQVAASSDSRQQQEAKGLREQLQAAVKASESNAQIVNQLRAEAQQEAARNAQLLADMQARDRSLSEAKAELAHLGQQANDDQASTVALRAKFNDLLEQLRTANAKLDMDRQLLAQGKDVRDLMGARQLHVVDVRDTDPTGKPGKAFGRVFLTEGKSLIFYAFDLNDAKLADAKHTFQVWGQEEGKPGSVHSLGFLFVDDKAQRRWSLKVENPRLVSEIDSVFVTVEPAAGATKPSGQRMLYAFLGDANHP
jgi:hypothetical protein